MKTTFDKKKILFIYVIIGLAFVALLFKFVLSNFSPAQAILEKQIALQGGVSSLKGLGTLEDPYRIRCKSELLFMEKYHNENADETRWVYSLENDIDLSKGDGDANVVIGEGDDHVFKGIFLGNGHTISGLEMSGESGKSGLFWYLWGEVYDLTVSGSSSGDCAGGIAGDVNVNAFIGNCSSYVNASGDHAGAIAGSSEGHIINCVSMTGQELIGENYGNIANSYVKQGSSYVDSADKVAYGRLATSRRLNSNMSMMRPDIDLHKWYPVLSVKLTPILSMPLCEAEYKTRMGDEEVKIKGFFSKENHAWIVAAPDGCVNDGDGVVFRVGPFSKTISINKETRDYDFKFLGRAYQLKMATYSESDTLYIKTYVENGLGELYKDKGQEIPATYLTLDKKGEISEGLIDALSCRGNDSYQPYSVWKNSFSIGLRNRESLLGLRENEDYVLFAGFREDSVLAYIMERDLFINLNLPYAYDYDMVHLYIDGEYRGFYMLSGAQEIDNGRYELYNSYEETKALNKKKLSEYEQIKEVDDETGAMRIYYDIPRSPEDVSGGYILEVDYKDYPDTRSRFVSKHGTTITMKSNNYASKEQVYYCADLWQNFEDALFSPDGYNEAGGYYGDYMDLESLADLCLMLELNADSSLSGSVYFYTDKNDNKLHAGCHWDSEKSFVKFTHADEYVSHLGWRDHSKYDEEGVPFWAQLYEHEDFVELIKSQWNVRYKEAANALLGDGDYSINYYREKYSSDEAVDNLKWEELDFNRKCSKVEEYLEKRLLTLNEWLQ